LRFRETVVSLVEDFGLDGEGSAPAWNAAEWLALLPIKGNGKYESLKWKRK
jgi:hypothetical protein